MHDILFYITFSVIVIIGVLSAIGIIIENQYLIYISLIVTYIIVMSTLLFLGVYYV